jgi:hypothetical protein
VNLEGFRFHAWVLCHRWEHHRSGQFGGLGYF